MAWAVGKARPVLDRSTGAINLHGRGGLVIRFRMQACGVFLSLLGRTLVLELAAVPPVFAGAHVTLTPGADATEQLATISDALAGQLPLAVAVPIVIRDTSTTPIFAAWASAIRTFGFNTAPA